MENHDNLTEYTLENLRELADGLDSDTRLQIDAQARKEYEANAGENPTIESLRKFLQYVKETTNAQVAAYNLEKTDESIHTIYGLIRITEMILQKIDELEQAAENEAVRPPLEDYPNLEVREIAAEKQKARQRVNKLMRDLNSTLDTKEIKKSYGIIQRGLANCTENYNNAGTDTRRAEIERTHVNLTEGARLLVERINQWNLPDTFSIPDNRRNESRDLRIQLSADARGCADATELSALIDATLNSIGHRPELLPDVKSDLEAHIREHILNNQDSERNVRNSIRNYRETIIDAKIFDKKQEAFKLTLKEFAQLTPAEQQAIINTIRTPERKNVYKAAVNPKELPIVLHWIYQNECVLSPEDARNLSLDISPIIADPTTNPDSADILLKSRRAHEADIRTRTHGDMLRRQLDEFNTNMRTAGAARDAEQLLEDPTAYDYFVNRAEVMNPPSAAQIEQIKNELATGFNTDTLTFKQDFIDSHSQDPAELRSEFLTRHAELRRLCTPPDAPLNLKRDRQISNKIKKLQEICKAYHESKQYHTMIEEARNRLVTEVTANPNTARERHTREATQGTWTGPDGQPQSVETLRAQATTRAAEAARLTWESNDENILLYEFQNCNDVLNSDYADQAYSAVTNQITTGRNDLLEQNSNLWRELERRRVEAEIYLAELEKYDYKTSELQLVFCKSPDEAKVLFTFTPPGNTLLEKKKKELEDKLKDKKHSDYKNKDKDDTKGSKKRALDTAALEYIKSVIESNTKQYLDEMPYDTEAAFVIDSSMKKDLVSKTQKIQEEILKNVSNPVKRCMAMKEGLTHLEDGNQQFLTSGGVVNKSFVLSLLVRRYFIDFISQNETVLFEGIPPMFLEEAGDGTRKGIKHFITQSQRDKTFIKTSEFGENPTFSSLIEKEDTDHNDLQRESIAILTEESAIRAHDVVVQKSDKILERTVGKSGIEQLAATSIYKKITPILESYQQMADKFYALTQQEKPDYSKEIVGTIFIPTPIMIRSHDGKKLITTNRPEQKQVTAAEFQSTIKKQIETYLDLANQYVDTCIELDQKHGSSLNAYKVFTEEVPKLLFPNEAAGGSPVFVDSTQASTLRGLLRREISEYKNNKSLRSYRVQTEQRAASIKMRADYTQTSYKLVEKKIIEHYPIDSFHTSIIIKSLIREHIIGLGLIEKSKQCTRMLRVSKKPPETTPVAIAA